MRRNNSEMDLFYYNVHLQPPKFFSFNPIWSCACIYPLFNVSPEFSHINLGGEMGITATVFGSHLNLLLRVSIHMNYFGNFHILSFVQYVWHHVYVRVLWSSLLLLWRWTHSEESLWKELQNPLTCTEDSLWDRQEASMYFYLDLLALFIWMKIFIYTKIRS